MNHNVPYFSAIELDDFESSSSSSIRCDTESSDVPLDSPVDASEHAKEWTQWAKSEQAAQENRSIIQNIDDFALEAISAIQWTQSAESEQSAESIQSIESFTESVNLPVATPVQSQERNTLSSEVVLDGLIVNDRSKSKKIVEIVALLVTIVVIIAAVATVTNLQSKRESSDNPSTQLSLSPSTTSSPTTIFNYDAYVKEIALTISREEDLNDSSSMQYKVWKLMAKQLPVLVESNKLQLNDTKSIAQRYTIAVVGGSASAYLSALPDILFVASKDFDECNLPFFTCNDDNEVTGVYLVNERSTIRGGGMLPTEIGLITNLAQIKIVRSALRGTIPSEIGSLKHLRILDMKDNFISGTIPTEIGQLQNLELVDMNRNLLEKEIPSYLGNLKNLLYLDVSQNLLTGSIPIEFAALNQLKGLVLYNNSMTGSLEFLCDEESRNGTEDSTFVEGESQYSYNVEAGYIVNCESEGNEKGGLTCSCCSCAQ